jgi:hypothetical protein
LIFSLDEPEVHHHIGGLEIGVMNDENCKTGAMFLSHLCGGEQL